MLTNGVVWQVYHLTGGLPVILDLAVEVDMLADQALASKAGQLYYLSKESLKRHQLDDLWKAKAATAPRSLAQVLTTEAVADAVRRELRRSTGQNVDAKEIVRLLRETVIRTECL